jgi:hypothetical protein
MIASNVDVDTRILARVLAPEAASFSPEVARAVLELHFPDFDLRRMAELAEKARQGNLTPPEQAEADGYERVSSILGFLKSKARVSLKNAAGS